MSNVTKTFEWEELEPGWFYVKRDSAGSIIPPYEVHARRDGTVYMQRADWIDDPTCYETFDGTVDEAKRACQQHFEALVNAVLV